MKIFRHEVLVLLAMGGIFGCGSTSNNPTDIKVTSVTFVNKGPVNPSASSTKIVIKTDSIEYSKIQADQVVEKWTRQLKTTDFLPVQNLASKLYNAPDVTLQSDQAPCNGWRGMTITMEKLDASHSLEISGAVCDRAQWPADISNLVDLKDALAAAVACPAYSPAAPDWCSGGTILSPIIDENGCVGPPRCKRPSIACPQYSPPAPDWCADGIVIPPVIDGNGCYGPPSCQHNQKSIQPEG